jgi:hypothetical protein
MIKTEAFSGVVCRFQRYQNSALKGKCLKLISYKKKSFCIRFFYVVYLIIGRKIGPYVSKAALCPLWPVTLHLEVAGQAPSHLE